MAVEGRVYSKRETRYKDKQTDRRIQQNMKQFRVPLQPRSTNNKKQHPFLTEHNFTERDAYLLSLFNIQVLFFFLISCSGVELL